MRAAEEGSAVAEFVMVLVLLLFLFFALVTIGLWAYSRTLLTSAAAQAARYAANADVPDQAASQRAAEIMAHTLAGSTAGTVTCTNGSGTALMLEVHCTMKAPGIMPMLNGIMPDISVTGHALRETP